MPCAGIAGLTGMDSARVVSVNYFGAIEPLETLRPLPASPGRRRGSGPWKANGCASTPNLGVFADAYPSATRARTAPIVFVCGQGQR